MATRKIVGIDFTRPMNLALQDPFAVAKEYPDTLVQSLSYGFSVVIQFNHKGDYLALGLADGSIVIFDMASMGVVAQLKGGHVRPITSISWSRDGRYLLSSARDWRCKLWDLAAVLEPNQTVVGEIKFDGPIWMATLHPYHNQVMAATLFEEDPVVVDFSLGKPIVHRLPTNPTGHEAKDKHVTLVSTFTPNGRYLFTGTLKGWINVFEFDDENDERAAPKLVHLTKICNSNIKLLCISPNGGMLAVNSSDRIIRQVRLPDMYQVQDPEQWEFEVEHKYQDVVNRLQWNSVSFNHNGDFLCASTYGNSSHDLYMWETQLGSLTKILEGSSEELVDVKWNYPRCMIGSTGLDLGHVYLWLIRFPQKWSALAPDFVEVEENIEYQEKEDEFDIIDEDELHRKRREEQDFDVDIMTPETTDARGFQIEQSFVIPIDYEKYY